MDLTFGSLFAGIGGFDLGLEASGMRCKWQVEIDAFASSVLRKHWPESRLHRDITEFFPSEADSVDVVCGGFPCQDISNAGTGEGLDGARSGLWSEYQRIIGTLRPRYVVVENVSALVRRGLDRVCGDLAKLGYDAEWQTFFASDFGLPHRRERIFIVAYPNEIFRGEREGLGTFEDWPPAVFAADAEQRTSVRVQTADRFIGVDDGIPRKSYSHRACGIGNAVVPPAAQWVGQLIIEHDRKLRGDA